MLTLIFTNEDLERLEDTLDALGCVGALDGPRQDLSGVQSPPQPTNDDDAPSLWRRLNEMAMKDFPSWVPALGLYGCTPNVGGYKMVNETRKSGQGRPTELRKKNLSFHLTGIKDFGSDKRYTPLDIVLAVRSSGFHDAFDWLCERVKMPLDGDVMAFQSSTERRLIEFEDGTLADPETGEIVPPTPANENHVDDSEEFPEVLTHPAGLLGLIVDYICDTASRPNRTLALAAALVVLGTLIGRRDATPTKSGTHLYSLVLAPTGYGKQHPQDAGEWLVKVASQDRGNDLVGAPDYMSHTALVNEIVAKPLCVSFIDEFGDYLKR